MFLQNVSNDSTDRKIFKYRIINRIFPPKKIISLTVVSKCCWPIWRFSFVATYMHACYKTLASRGNRLYTFKSDVYRRHILTYKDGQHAVR